MENERKELGEILVEKGLITIEQLDNALVQQAIEDKFLGEILVEKGYITNKQIAESLTEQKKCDYINLTKIKNIKEDVIRIIPENIARRYKVLAIAMEKEKLVVAMDDPYNIVAIDTVMRIANKKIKVVRTEKQDLEEYLDKYYQTAIDLSGSASALEAIEREDNSVDVNQLIVAADDVPIVKFVNTLFLEAIEKRATDIHLEPQENKISVRFRIDGALYQFPPPPKSAYTGVVTRLKILSSLDIGERRLPQDGRTKITVGTREIDIRVSILPAIYGEKIVMRLLDRQSLVKTLDKIGFYQDEEDLYKKGVQKPYGMIIVTGPTGSGKTTTLYSGLHYINTPDKNIVTVEDPVEYELKGITQVQIKPKIGLTFAEILRSMLRQDPDIIMVGEIRDLETAKIAIQSALTGHLVISTLHTNDTVSTISRLNYMGVPNYLIAESLHLIMAQRLVRRICANCKQEDVEGKEILKTMDIPVKDKVYKGAGCSACNFTGYLGRVAIFEMLEVSRDIKKAISADAKEEDIRVLCAEQGFSSLRDAALKKVFAGITTVEEFLSKTIV
ncbi:MAG: Flp pilus assembly complex ATPase component TadA [Elusimicrobia bacterium]|nr:Flp pilus assembly complex ATPase component TadA [Elusimicrobiota bacterium]